MHPSVEPETPPPPPPPPSLNAAHVYLLNSPGRAEREQTNAALICQGSALHSPALLHKSLYYHTFRTSKNLNPMKVKLLSDPSSPWDESPSHHQDQKAAAVLSSFGAPPPCVSLQICASEPTDTCCWSLRSTCWWVSISDSRSRRRHRGETPRVRRFLPVLRADPVLSEPQRAPQV